VRKRSALDWAAFFAEEHGRDLADSFLARA
jgi:hypothetical protein